MLRTLADKLLAVTFPQSCHVCRSSVERHSDGVACADCWNSTRFFSDIDTLCAKCGLPLEGGRYSDDVRCRSCEDRSYDRAAACGIYEKALSSTVLHLKRFPIVPGRIRDAVEPALARAEMLAHDLIVPVPLSAKRRVERGFNQAEVIARIVAKATGAPLDSRSLVRRFHTPMHRAGMDRRAREDSVEKAFVVSRPKLVEGKSILLVDDILTSGATASNCAAILKKNGAREVNVFALARAASTR